MIRNMLESDLDKVLSIYEQGIEEGLSTFNSVCPSKEEWDRAHLQDCRFVYEENGCVQGWVAISPTSARVAYKGVVEVSIYIGKAYRGKGIGKQLLNRVIEESETLGYWCLYAAIFEINETSIKLHKNCGFREIGFREKIAKDKFGVWQNTILMERRSHLEELL